MNALESDDKLQMKRSTSMPVKPRPLDPRPLARSPEKETVNDTDNNDVDYYPESPSCSRRRKSKQTADHFETRSEQNFPYTLDWAGSTIELSPDTDADGLRRSNHRVMNKNGHENILFRRIPEKSWRYMRDAITTLVRSLFGHRATTSTTKTQQISSERSNIYSITPSIQRKLDELANESPTKIKNIPKTKPNEKERVTFSI